MSFLEIRAERRLKSISVGFSLPKEVTKWSPQGRRKRGTPKLTWAEGIRGLMGENGLTEDDWNDRHLDKEDNIIVKWAQKDVETLYNLLNK